MNTITVLNKTENLTMSSREIADLANARHNDVVSTIVRLFDKGLLRSNRKTRNESTGGRPIEVYDLVLLDVYLVISGYSDEVRSRIIDRWQELEDKVKNNHTEVFAIPKTYSEALLLAGKLAQDKELLEAKVEEDKPKVEFHDGVTNADNCHDIGELAKLLNLGFGRTTMFKKLREMGYLQQGNVPYQRHIEAGLFKVNESVYSVVSGYDGERKEKIKLKTLVTGKGVVYFQRKFKSV